MNILYVILVSNVIMFGLILQDLFTGKTIVAKGKTVIYLILWLSVFIVFYVGIYPTKYEFMATFLRSISAALELFVFKFNFDLISITYNQSVLFRYAYISTLLIVYYYLLQFILKNFFKTVTNQIKINLLVKKPLTVVIGYNEEATKYINNHLKNTILWVETKVESKVPIYVAQYCKERFRYLSISKNVEFITFFDDEVKSLHIANMFFSSLNSSDFTESNIFLTILAKESHNQAYQSIVNSGKGLIKVVNKYDIIAKEFIKIHPLSKYLDQTFIDYQTGLLNQEKHVQVVFIGFGKVNQHLYLSTVMNSQFVSVMDKKLVTKPVSYYIFDKEDKLYNKRVNHTFFRYDQSSFDNDEYFETVPKIHETTFQKININDKGFYPAIDQIINKKDTKTFIIISIGDDLENLDFILTIKEHIHYLKLDNIELFLRIKDYQALDNVFKDNSQLNDVHIFGSYEQYLKNEVLFDRLLDFASIRKAKDYTQSKILNQEQIVKARENWSSIDIYKQESNRYSTLNLNFKLNLLGYTIYNENASFSSLDDFYHKYDKDNIRNQIRNEYHTQFPYCSREVMAFQEHQRWNAFHIVNGFIPMPIKDIKVDKTKDIHLKQHACLTTFDGLDDYHNHLIHLFLKQNANQLSKNELFLLVDVKKYDYHSLDQLDKMLDELNTKLKNKC